MYHLILFAVNSTFSFSLLNPPFFLHLPPFKIFLPPTFFSPPPPLFLLRSLSNSHFLSPSKKWGCKPKKVGGVNTQNTPGFGTPMGMGYAWFRVWLRAWVMHGLGYGDKNSGVRG